MISQTGRPVGQVGVKERRSSAFGKAGLAGATVKHASLVVAAIVVANDQISRPALAPIVALGIQATKPRQIVHGGTFSAGT